MTHSVIMPDLGQTVSEGKVLRWLKKPGDTVKKGEPLFEVETDKVTVEVEAYRDGTLREILAGEGQVASAMTAVAILTDDAREPYERPAPLPPSAVPASPLASAPPAASSAPREIVASPAARSLARELGVQLDGVTRSEEHTSKLQSRLHLVCRLLLEKKKKTTKNTQSINTYQC